MITTPLIFCAPEPSVEGGPSVVTFSTDRLPLCVILVPILTSSGKDRPALKMEADGGFRFPLLGGVRGGEEAYWEPKRCHPDMSNGSDSAHLFLSAGP